MGIVSIDALMKIDRGLITEIPVKEVRAKHLSKIMGADVSVKIKALSGNTYSSLMATAKNKKGGIDVSKLYKAQSLIVVEGVQEPSLKDKELQAHFGAASPVDLAAILFPGGEMVDIYSDISMLSGYGDDEDEDGVDEEVKNS